MIDHGRWMTVADLRSLCHSSTSAPFNLSSNLPPTFCRLYYIYFPPESLSMYADFAHVSMEERQREYTMSDSDTALLTQQFKCWNLFASEPW